MIEHYDDFFRKFTADYQVVVCEHPGQGFSVHKPSFGFTLPEHSEAIEEMILQLDLTRVILILPCVAAYVGLPLAHRHPRRVHRVVLLQAPAWEEERKWVARIDPRHLLRCPGLGQLIMGRIRYRKKMATVWYKIALANKQDRPRFTDVAHQEFDHGGCFCLASMLQQFMRHHPTFEPISQPTLIIWGMKDKSHLPTDKQTARQLAQQTTYYEWDDAGHFPELEQTDRFKRVLDDFLQEEPS